MVLSSNKTDLCLLTVSGALVAVASVPDSPTLLGALELWAAGMATVGRPVVLGCSAVFTLCDACLSPVLDLHAVAHQFQACSPCIS